jgi:hypothetical protein
MMQVLTILLFTILQFLCGFGILNLLKVYFQPAICISLSVLIGVAVFSFIPFLLQLAYVPLTSITIFSGIMVSTVLLSMKSGRALLVLFNTLKTSRFQLRLYEVPFLLLIAFMVFLSVWRCYYYPPTPRDLTSGAEVIAEYAIKEKTMINSVFSVDLSTTNNQFKPPFITSLQIIYKYAEFPFGQVWLSTVFIGFLVFLYKVLCFRLHKTIAGLLLVIFVAIPEMFGYTIMALFDYSNSIFFCLSLYLLFEYFKNGRNNQLVLSGIFMGIATYIRSETLILAGFMFPALLFYWGKKGLFKNVMRDAVYFLVPSVFIYLLSITIYINYYLPSEYPFSMLLNQKLSNLIPFYQRLTEMTEKLLLSGDTLTYYGYFVFLFILVLSVNTFLKNAWNKVSLNWLFAVLVIYVGIPLLGYLFPLYDLDNSTKRGLLKIFPLMLLFMANSKILVLISGRIKKWEVTR